MSRPIEPVTTGGWYEHDDGTVCEYHWRTGVLVQTQSVAGWADVPRPASEGPLSPRSYERDT